MPFLAGDLRPSWNRRQVALDGRRVIEVSLDTGDRRLASARSKELDSLVQAAVREAERREAVARSAERDRVVPERLAPDAIRAMAGQILHAALADHNRSFTEPGHLNGTAQVIGKVLAGGAGGRGPARSNCASRSCARARTFPASCSRVVAGHPHSRLDDLLPRACPTIPGLKAA